MDWTVQNDSIDSIDSNDRLRRALTIMKVRQFLIRKCLVVSVVFIITCISIHLRGKHLFTYYSNHSYSDDCIHLSRSHLIVFDMSTIIHCLYCLYCLHYYFRRIHRIFLAFIRALINWMFWYDSYDSINIQFSYIVPLNAIQ